MLMSQCCDIVLRCVTCIAFILRVEPFAQCVFAPSLLQQFPLHIVRFLKPSRQYLTCVTVVNLCLRCVLVVSQFERLTRSPAVCPAQLESWQISATKLAAAKSGLALVRSRCLRKRSELPS